MFGRDQQTVSADCAKRASNRKYLKQVEYPVSGDVIDAAGVIDTTELSTANTRVPTAAAQQAAASTSMLWSSAARWMLLLSASILLSAMLVVYSKDLSRRLFIDYGMLRQQQHQLQVDWGRLLLENATLSTPARIQQIATNQLAMVLPTARTTAMVVMPQTAVELKSHMQQQQTSVTAAAVSPAGVSLPANTQVIAAH